MPLRHNNSALRNILVLLSLVSLKVHNRLVPKEFQMSILFKLCEKTNKTSFLVQLNRMKYWFHFYFIWFHFDFICFHFNFNLISFWFVQLKVWMPEIILIDHINKLILTTFTASNKIPANVSLRSAKGKILTSKRYSFRLN